MDWMLAFVESPVALTAWGVEGTARMLVVVREKFAAHLHSMRADARVGRLSFENSSTSCAEGEHALLKKQNHGYSPLQDVDNLSRIQSKTNAFVQLPKELQPVNCDHLLLYTPFPNALGYTRHTPKEHVRGNMLQVKKCTCVPLRCMCGSLSRDWSLKEITLTKIAGLVLPVRCRSYIRFDAFK
jgi:hypothetical protein